MSKTAAYLLAAFVALGLAAESGAAPALEQIGEFTVPEANQGVGVDAQPLLRGRQLRRSASTTRRPASS